MNQKEDILNRIKRNKPHNIPAPALSFRREAVDLVEQFSSTAQKTGASIEHLPSPTALAHWIEKQKDPDSLVLDLTKNVDEGHNDLLSNRSIGDADLIVISGVLGVAENGAIWVPEDMMMFRTSPFVARHLAIVLNSGNIVADMHEAYARIDLRTTGFGVFIAGPSKTADIEQSLVIGAHGPVRNTVLLH